MVEDPELPFPESVAAGEIHKAGQRGATAAKILFANMGIGAFVYFLGAINVFAASKECLVRVGTLGTSAVRLARAPGYAPPEGGRPIWLGRPASST